MIIEIPNFLDDKTIAYIIERVSPFLENSELPTYHRQGKSVSITTEPLLNDVDETLFNIYYRIYNEIVRPEFSPLFEAEDSGYEFHRYYAGDICTEHCDYDVMDGSIRFATVILHLTTNDDADLIFPKQNKVIKTESGKLVIFPPNGMYPHYLTKSSRDRDVLISWFQYSDFKVTKTEAI